MAKRMTARQRECQKIAEAKARQKARARALRRFAMACAFAVSLMALGSVWFMQGDTGAGIVGAAQDRFFALTARSGFRVEHVYLEGRNHTSMEKINQALQVKAGSPILAQSPREIQTRLQALDRVQYAEVERVLPSSLHIHIVEREPIAIWQNRGNLRLIDNTGRIMEDVAVAAYRQLPIVIGENAPSHAPELFTLLAKDPDTLKQITAAIRIGERRWNLRFKNGVEVKMPERDMAAAWTVFETMQAQNRLMEKAVRTVDFRLPGKVFLTLSAPEPSPETEPSATPAASERPTLPAGAHET